MRGRRRLGYMALYPTCIVTRISGSCRSSSETAAAMEYRWSNDVVTRWPVSGSICSWDGSESATIASRVGRLTIDESAPWTDSLTRWVDD